MAGLRPFTDVVGRTLAGSGTYSSSADRAAVS